MALDPVDYAVISQGLIAAAREMGVKLIRSAYSTILREAQDGSAALMDRDGNVVSQAELIPMQLGPMKATFVPCAEFHPVDTLKPGDFYISNDPFNGGQHLPDVFIFSPIFYEGEVVGFGASVAHHLDLGGGAPGLNADATDVYQEGLRIPPSCYNMETDWNGGRFERLVASNIRVPQLTIGDFNAQFAANAIGGLRVKELCAKYGVAAVKEAMAELMDYSERRVRAAILEVPDGTYEGEDAVDDDGITDTPLVIRTQVTIAGDEVSISFDGTCDQIGRNLNSPFSSTMSAALACVKSVLTSADIPFNEGMKRPIRIDAPYGSILNPKPPAPVRARMEPAYRVFNAVMKALAQVVPEKVIACGFDTTSVFALSHLSAQGYRVYVEVFGGGYGAGARNDGCNGVDSPLSNCSNTPVEALDMEYDYFRVVDYGLVPDSAGAGRHRGGLGFTRAYEMLKDDVTFALYADRFRIAPAGLFGGRDGMMGRCELTRSGKVIPLKSKDAMTLQKGDVLAIHVGGGAGYGDPAERDRAAIELDLADGIITAGTALRDYPALAAE
ncbi:MAG: hydantoinase B/oxoprolinase family protein [Proteobacteria bacterium]|nr:hydantoinase B/oxoprolinase family protein [Pseudomonadota bacterium]MDA1072320.1 hydantoinase B/oxoprolinase family protein [Pseudomonadota bacterium]